MSTNPASAPAFPPETLSWGDTPFHLSQEQAYRRWREARLADRVSDPTELMVTVRDPARLSEAERAALVTRILRCNMAFYRCADSEHAADRDTIRRLGATLGLERFDNHLCAEEDGISRLRVSEGGLEAEYIPYTNRPLSWHCDGYYNPPDRRIRAMLLHCVSDAPEGGENAYMDHELLYIRLRDENPAWIEALSHPQAITIPPNVVDGETLRGAQSGPVYSVDPQTGRLHMRYTARLRNIRWRDDPDTLAAAARIRELLGQEDNPDVLRYRLAPGEGVVCNNVLHARTGFRDDAGGGHQRLIYRARYLDRVAGT
jgi:hypothetical protein